MKIKLLITYLLLAASVVNAAGPRFPFPNTPDEVGQNDRDLNDAIVTLEGKAVLTNSDGSVTLSSATITTLNSTTVNTTALNATTVTATTVSATTVTVASINGSYIGGFKNRISNGECRFDQRNEGTAYTINNSSLRALDMVLGEAPPAQGVFTLQRQTSVVPNGFSHALKAETTTADTSGLTTENYDIRFPIEGNDVRDFLLGTSSAKTFTVSFWVRSSLTGTFGVGFGNNGFNRTYVGQYTINAANTWEYKSITVPGDTTGTWVTGITNGLRLLFDVGGGTSLEGTANAWNAANTMRASGNVRLISTLNATWYMTGLQVELGNVASAFEYLPESVALARIQRYIEKSYSQGTATDSSTSEGQTLVMGGQTNTTTVLYSHIRYHVEKRTVPTLTFWSNAGDNGQWLSIATNNANTLRTVSTTSTGKKGFSVFQTNALDYGFYGHWLASSEL